MSEHTPIPWRLGGTFMPGTSGESVNIWGAPAPGDQSGWIVASNLAPENARRIVLAVNCHDDLLAALRNLADFHEEGRVPTPLAIDRAHAAIEKATGT